jgi:alpha-L-rhamnosidase
MNKLIFLITCFYWTTALHAQSPAILRQEFLYDTAPFPECHAATIAETPKGLVAAFFGGTKERNPDVCIYVCRKDHGASHWTAPVNVANGIQNSTLRYACWNPVLYQVPAGDLLLFYKVGPSPAKWKGWLIRSKDGGATWSKPEQLPEAILGPIKNQPIRLHDGALLCPSSTEGNGWHIHFELTRDLGHTWEQSAPPADTFRAIQPTLLLHKNGVIQALSRSENRAILSTLSTDNGHTWSPQQPIGLPNNNSGIDGTTLADGRQLLVYNHVLPPPGETKGERSPLNVALSPDGTTWYAALVLEDDHTGQYSYPTVIQSSDGKVHIVYTWHHKKIKYVELDPSRLKLEKITNGIWPDTIKK